MTPLDDPHNKLVFDRIQRYVAAMALGWSPLASIELVVHGWDGEQVRVVFWPQDSELRRREAFSPLWSLLKRDKHANAMNGVWSAENKVKSWASNIALGFWSSTTR